MSNDTNNLDVQTKENQMVEMSGRIEEIASKDMLLQKVIAFHGHLCPGLIIGYKAAIYAKELLSLDYSEDENVVCVSENDACGVDAIQVVLGCTVGKGNLNFRLRGKHAYSFYNRLTGKSVRLCMRYDETWNTTSKTERTLKMLTIAKEELFAVTDAPESPEEAGMFATHPCSICGEGTAEYYLRVVNNQYVCQDCFHTFNRFE